MKKTLLLSAMVLAFTSAANAAEAPVPSPGDVSSADIQWVGHAKIIPGNDITITGADGALEPNDGVLTVNADGTFTTKTAVQLESRLYFDADGDDVKEAGDLFATNWTLDAAKPITVTWGTNVTAGMDPQVQETSSGLTLTTDKAAEGLSQVYLQVSNEKAATVAPTDPRADLTVNATILATVA